MEKFIARYRSLVTAVLSGFDRLVFRGHLLPLMRDGGMFFFLEAAKVRLLDFKGFVTSTTDRLKEASLAEARELDRPVLYLDSPTTSKEDVARQLLAEHPVEQGLICILTALEPCMTFEYHRSQNRDERGLKVLSAGLPTGETAKIRLIHLADVTTKEIDDFVKVLEDVCFGVARGE